MKNQWKNKLKTLYIDFLNFLYPHKCLLCGVFIDHEGFCDSCLAHRIQQIKKPYCKICSEELNIRNVSNIDNLICGNCLSKKYYFDKALSIFKYNKDIATVIHLFKFRNKFILSEFLASFLLEKINEFNDKIDYIAPVPIHKKKLQIRGYNQTVLLTNEFVKHGYTNIINDLLIKSVQTKAQSELNYSDRVKNLTKSFILNSKYIDTIKGKNILIIDDVFTTGSTANECAKILKRFKANKVFVLTLAKTTLNKKDFQQLL